MVNNVGIREPSIAKPSGYITILYCLKPTTRLYMHGNEERELARNRDNEGMSPELIVR